jgi:hypothetical protein
MCSQSVWIALNVVPLKQVTIFIIFSVILDASVFRQSAILGFTARLFFGGRDMEDFVSGFQTFVKLLLLWLWSALPVTIPPSAQPL